MTAAANTPAATVPLSLRLKLTVWMVVISLVSQLTLSVVVVVYERQSIGQFFNQRMRSLATSIAQSLRQSDFKVEDADLARLANQNTRYILIERRIVVLYDERGAVVASSVRPAPSANAMGAQRAVSLSEPVIVREAVAEMTRPGDDDSTSRVLLQQLIAGDGRRMTLLVAADDSYFETVTRVTERVMIAGIVIGLLASAVGGWMIAGLATAPLVDLMRLAGSLTPDQIESDVDSMATTKGQRVVEQELRDVRSKLRAALQARDRFVSNVSHELKTPIAVLLTEAQTLHCETASPEHRKFVSSVIEEMRRMGNTVESFLMLTKLQGGKELVGVHPQSVNDFVMEAIAACNKMARQYNVSLSPALAETDPPLRVFGNADLLRAMMDNLIQNAIRFSPEQQVVMVSVAARDTECEIAVRDFGPGIPEELTSAVFDRFVQAPEESIRSRGFGLGLSIAQGIAELHRGRISVRNLPEGGCEFTVALPQVSSVS